jgi:hypothetical protein
MLSNQHQPIWIPHHAHPGQQEARCTSGGCPVKYTIGLQVEIIGDSSVRGECGSISKVEDGDEDDLCITVQLPGPKGMEDWVMRPNELRILGGPE